MAFCPQCGAQNPDNAAFCGSCGKVTTSAATPGAAPPMMAPPMAGAGLADNVAGMLAYLTIIPAIVFLAVEPHNKKPFVRFHAFQSIFLFVAWVVVWMAITLVVAPFMWTFAYMLHSLLGLGMFILWIILMLKAYQGQMFKVPVIGDLAQKQANSM